MEELTLVLDKPNTAVVMKDRSLWITRENQEPLSVPLGCLGSLLVVGKPMVSCDVWRALAEANISVCLFPGRGNQAPAFMGAGLSTGLEKRRKQHAVYTSPSARLSVATAIVSRKFTAYKDALHILDSLKCCPLSISDPDKDVFRNHIEQATERLGTVSEMNSLLGTEGAASRAWFSFLRQSLHSKWNFTGRNRRPPKDPLNSLLSLTYSMIASKAQQAAHWSGLDPQLGFLHAPRPGRPALSLDIIEAVRPTADIFALGVLDLMQPSDFTVEARFGCTLVKAAKRRYFSAWASQQHHWLNTEASDGRENDESGDIETLPLNSTLRNLVTRLYGDIDQLSERLVHSYEPDEIGHEQNA